MTTPLLPFDAPVLVTPRRRRETPVTRELRRLNDRQCRVLAYLQAHGKATNVELSAPEVGGLGGVRRTWELRQQGWDIRPEKVQGGTWIYTFHGLKS